LAGLAQLTALPAQTLSAAAPTATITNVVQFREWAGQTIRTNWPVRLEGTVCWSAVTRGMVVLQDPSGAALIETDPQTEVLPAGRKILLTGTYAGSRGKARATVAGIALALDCSNAVTENSGVATLKPGRYPVTVSWSSGANLAAVDLLYEGAGLARQTLPDADLSHQPAGGTNWAPGLVCTLTDGAAGASPATSLAPNFQTVPGPHSAYFDCTMEGRLQIHAAGDYRFSLVPIGRDQLFVGDAKIISRGSTEAPVAEPVTPGQVTPEQVQSQWVSVEGAVTYVSRSPARNYELELSSEAGKIRVTLGEDPVNLTDLFPGGRVRATGVSRGAHRLDGPTVPGTLWVPAASLLQLLEVAPELWSSHAITPITNLPAAPGQLAPLVHVAGKMDRVLPNRAWVIDDGTAQAEITTAQPCPAPGDQVEVLAAIGRVDLQLVLTGGFYREVEQAQVTTNRLPLLTTAGQVKRLQHDEALRSYPVHLRGVLTWCGGGGFVLQDSTMGIFAQAMNNDDSGRQRVGDYVEVDGTTTAQFSPMVLARQITRLGLGVLPEPVRPTWDQLMDGALDTEYVEVQGVVTAVDATLMTLMTHDGKLQIYLPEKHADEIKPYLDSIVRIRGCLWAVKDETSHVLIPGAVQIHDATIHVDQEAPQDPFAAPLKHVADLLLFDVKASAFQRVKIAGQIVYRHGQQYYLMDQANGLQCVVRNHEPLAVGDEVEVVGFPVVGGLSPSLREAYMRKTGQAPLPAPRELTDDALLHPEYDATRVTVQARLTSVSREQQGLVFDWQIGSHLFAAKLNEPAARASVPVGSLVALTGVYVGRGGDRMAGRAIDSFELLLNSPGDIQIVARPPWWTLRRLLGAISLLAAILAVALVWIRQLHRQVEQRTAQLRQEVLAREQIEHQRVIEAERARIARDLHDDLGSSLTEISMLADAGAGRPPSLDKAGERFHTIGARARTIVNALDVIVWLVNPQKDSLPFLISYLGSYAEEYMAPSGIACRVKAPADVPSLKLTADFRHNLFLAVKEALNNVVRHSGATEMRFEIAVAPGELRVTITDDGGGFATDQAANGNGLANCNGRLASLGGHCQISSRPGNGTAVTFVIPLPNN
jgi:signal transduction histidine kinase